GDGAESARPPRRVRAVPIAERRDRRRDTALRLPVPAHAARSRSAPRLGAFALRRGAGRGSLGGAAQPPARAHRSEPAVLLDRDYLGRGSGRALRRTLEVARSRRPAAHRRGGEHGDRAGRQCHRAAAALGGRAAGPVAGRARRLPGGPAAPRSAPVHDSVLERRVARLELLVAERDAQVEDLQARLDEARQEVVRALAKLQTVASRAEAASAIAEAEIAVQALRAATGT